MREGSYGPPGRSRASSSSSSSPRSTARNSTAPFSSTAVQHPSCTHGGTSRTSGCLIFVAEFPGDVIHGTVRVSVPA